MNAVLFSLIEYFKLETYLTVYFIVTMYTCGSGVNDCQPTQNHLYALQCTEQKLWTHATSFIDVRDWLPNCPNGPLFQLC